MTDQDIICIKSLVNT